MQQSCSACGCCLSRSCSGGSVCAEALQQGSGCVAAANAGSLHCSTFQHVLLQAPDHLKAHLSVDTTE